MADSAVTQQLKQTAVPLLSVVVASGGQVQINCNLPKLEAVKLLLNVVEELRLQGYREQDRLVQVAACKIAR